MQKFLAALDASLIRGVQSITVVVLHGRALHWAAVAEALAYIRNYDEAKHTEAPASKYEIDVRYNNGDVIHGVFQQKAEAIRFLQSFA